MVSMKVFECQFFTPRSKVPSTVGEEICTQTPLLGLPQKLCVAKIYPPRPDLHSWWISQPPSSLSTLSWKVRLNQARRCCLFRCLITLWFLSELIKIFRALCERCHICLWQGVLVLNKGQGCMQISNYASIVGLFCNWNWFALLV